MKFKMMKKRKKRRKVLKKSLSIEDIDRKIEELEATEEKLREKFEELKKKKDELIKLRGELERYKSNPLKHFEGIVVEEGRILIPLKNFEVEEKGEALVVRPVEVREEESLEKVEEAREKVEVGQVDILGLTDIKKEFEIKPRPIEEKIKEMEEQKKLVNRIKNFFKRKKVESEKEKLRRLCLENLKKAELMKSKKDQVVACAHILKQLLEVKLRIPKSLTYSELIGELEKSKEAIPMKEELIDFFRRMSVEEYADGLEKEEPGFAFKLAKEAIEKLTK